MSARLRRVRKLEAARVRLVPPPAWPGVVFVLEATPDRPPGRWVRPDGATEVLVYDPAGPKPDVRFPGNPSSSAERSTRSPATPNCARRAGSSQPGTPHSRPSSVRGTG
ncbi:hypothetical protein PX52LOC_07839 [Limnoglobus roseus]|uniref:Uncharacterized protein n=1 Tax=Limnoglobus roseus TaxID=2598579 RepID=A0A5C1AMT2_9BACT|nr:hypothetical protein PX52LOC_07839 [Limnoglobus roseus]